MPAEQTSVEQAASRMSAHMNPGQANEKAPEPKGEEPKAEPQGEEPKETPKEEQPEKENEDADKKQEVHKQDENPEGDDTKGEGEAAEEKPSEDKPEATTPQPTLESPGEIDLDYKFNAKVNGELETPTLKDLLNNWSGSQNWAKKTQDITMREREISQAEEAIKSQASKLEGQAIAPIMQGDAEALAVLEDEITQLSALSPDDYIGDSDKSNGELLQDKIMRLTSGRLSFNKKYDGIIKAQEDAYAKSLEQRKAHADNEYVTLVNKEPSFAEIDLYKFREEVVAKLGLSQQKAVADWDHEDFMFLKGRLSDFDDATKWRQLQAKKPKIEEEVNQRPTFLKSGISKSDATVKAEVRDKAKARHTKEGSIRSASKLFKDFI